ncbi:acyltransferase [Alphaproteobacteria bacterium]|nr:acyltransferase [Alphaproteobacteria bacterium]
MKSNKINYRTDIDGLRGYAVLFVVLYHFDLLYFQAGFLGVDIFFVISGFLITKIIIKDLDSNNFSILIFFHRRIKRIIPLLFFVIIICTILSYYFFLPKDLKDFSRSGFSSIFFLSNFYFFFRSEYFDSLSIVKPLLHTWSLSIEEQYYLIYPFLLMLIYKYYKNYIFIFLCIFTFLSFIFFLNALNNQIYLGFYISIFRIWEIFAGCLIALFTKESYLKIENNIFKFIINLISICLFIFLIFICSFFEYSKFNLFFLLPLTVLITSLIIYLNQYLMIASIIYTNNIIRFIGIISYSLFLIHWPILVFYNYFFETDEMTIKIILLIFSFLISFFTFRFIEKPFREKKINFKLFYLSLILLILIINIFFFYVEKTDGVKSRLSEENLNIYNNALTLPKLKCDKIIKEQCFHYNGESPSVVIWGDSHAFMYYDFFYNEFKQNKISWVYSSCYPLLDVFLNNEYSNNQTPNCIKKNINLLNLTDKENIKKILLIANWSENILGIEKRIEGNGLTNNFISSIGDFSKNSEEAKILFKDKLNKTINALKSKNIEIYISKPIPTFEFWVTNEALKKIIYEKSTEPISRDFIQYVERNSFVNDIFDSFNKKNVIKIIDPSEALCDKNKCYGFINNKIIYRDSNHLTKEGVDKVSNLFDFFTESEK